MWTAPDPATHSRAILDLAGLSAVDRQALAAYGGERLLRDIGRHLKQGERCLVTRVDGRLAGMTWVTRSRSYAPNSGRPTVLIERCFTLPEFRGRGAYPAALRHALSPDTSRAAPGEAVFIECSITNLSSVRGITKAGFGRVGTTIGWRGHVHFFPISKGAQ